MFSYLVPFLLPLPSQSHTHTHTHRFLLRSAATDTLTDINQTLLHAAAGAGHLEICAMLLSRTEIDINAQNESGKTALLMAVEAGFAPICELLLTAQCDVRKESFRGKIPIYAAAELNRLDIAKMLLPFTKQADLCVVIVLHSLSLFCVCVCVCVFLLLKIFKSLGFCVCVCVCVCVCEISKFLYDS
jgi:hypothetical protein